MAADGHPVTPELTACLSPYTRKHVRRFGKPLPFDLPCDRFLHVSLTYPNMTAEPCKTWFDEECHNLKYKRNASKKLLRDMQKVMDSSKTLKLENRKMLQAAITYCSGHLHQMDYWRYAATGYLIGSGVTEAA